MTSEALNIKLKLDIGDITAGVQKVKARLSSMANTVKQSIPQINNESKKAKTSLSGISKESDKVKKSLSNIGDAAKKSLSGIALQSNMTIQALAALSAASKNSKFGFSDEEESTDGVNESLGALQGTMNSILALDFWGALSNMFDGSKLKENMDKTKEHLGSFASKL